jgi:predicted ester cyclase
MTTTTPRHPVLERVVVAWTSGDPAKIAVAYTPNVRVQYPGHREGLRTIEELTTLITTLHRIFPDLWLRIDEELGSGDRLVARWTCGGTQRGSWTRGIPPTQRALEWTGLSLFTVVDGKVAAEWVEEDLLLLERQMGVVVDRAPETG